MNTTWGEVAAASGSVGLLSFDKVWHNSGQLTMDERRHLEEVFALYPLETSDFRVWLKQRARQLFENSVREGIHV